MFNIFLLLMADILHHLGWLCNPIENGINYQPPLVNVGFQPSTVPSHFRGKLAVSFREVRVICLPWERTDRWTWWGLRAKSVKIRPQKRRAPFWVSVFRKSPKRKPPWKARKKHCFFLLRDFFFKCFLEVWWVSKMFFFSIIPGTKKTTMCRWLAINGMMNRIFTWEIVV